MFNNNTRQTSIIDGNSLVAFTETIEDDKAAFITQGSAQLCTLNYSLVLCSAYHLMYVDKRGSATNNFNPVPPTTFGVNRPRTLTVNNESTSSTKGLALVPNTLGSQ